MKLIRLSATITIMLLIILTTSNSRSQQTVTISPPPLTASRPVSGCQIIVRLMPNKKVIQNLPKNHNQDNEVLIFKPDQPIWIRVTVQNLEPSKLYMVSMNPQYDFSFSLKNFDTGTVPLTSYGKMLAEASKETDSQRRVKTCIESQGSMDFYFLLSRRYDMTLGQHFLLSVSRFLSRDDGSGSLVKSNEVPITIDPDFGGAY